MSTIESTQSRAEETPAATLDQTSVTGTTPRHSAIVRVTHWVITLSFFALVLSGGEITVSHPRFYWGETGNVLTDPLFELPIPASRNLVPTGYGYVLPDQNGWSRALHFQTAWVLVLTGLLYVISGWITKHFRRDLLPNKTHLSWRHFANVILHHAGIEHPDDVHAESYNLLQRLTYLSVIFILFPLVIWTGLAMSPAFDSAIPATVTLLGGRQSARTIHFLVSTVLVIFLFVHVLMVWRAGFWSRMRAMTVGKTSGPKERV